MNVEVTAMALQNLRRSPGRSGLTLLGLAIGVGAFISMVSFGEGARRTVMDQFTALGTHLVRVRPNARTGQELRPLSDRDVALLRKEVNQAGEVVAIARENVEASHAGRRFWTQAHGTDPAFPAIHEWAVSLGGSFSANDIEARSKVCVLGTTVAERLFTSVDESVLGEPVTLSGVLTCRVIGVLESKGVATSGRDLDDLVLLPVTTFNAYIGNPTGYKNIELAPRDPSLVEPMKAEVVEVLRRAHGLREGQADDFALDSPVEVIRAVERTSLVLARLLQGIALVSLFVGGVGIMNIQLVAVAERTQEIGIRSAIGASPRQILVQFLFEGALLSLLGSGLGVALGLGISLGVASAMGWQKFVSFWGVAGAAAFGVGVGLLFGYLPARRAALLDPIEALRRE